MRTAQLAIVVFLVLGAGAARAEDPPPEAVLFGKKCGSCHTLGAGDRTGPDLLGVTKRRERAWLASFIRTPGAMLDAGDPIAGPLLAKFKGVRMPDLGLSAEEVDSIIGYLAACEQAGGCEIVLGKIKHASEATPADVERGRLLFAGQARLTRGGPACLSCHNVRGAGVAGGGTIAKDLTFVYARLGDAGLSAALEGTPFPLMRNIYAKRQLHPDEAFALKAYFADAAKDGTPPHPDHTFVYLGVIGLFAAFGTIGAAWHGRLRGVRKAITRRKPA